MLPHYFLRVVINILIPYLATYMDYIKSYVNFLSYTPIMKMFKKISSLLQISCSHIELQKEKHIQILKICLEHDISNIIRKYKRVW